MLERKKQAISLMFLNVFFLFLLFSPFIVNLFKFRLFLARLCVVTWGLISPIWFLLSLYLVLFFSFLMFMSSFLASLSSFSLPSLPLFFSPHLPSQPFTPLPPSSPHPSNIPSYPTIPLPIFFLRPFSL